MALVQAEVDLCNMSLGRIGAKQITLVSCTANTRPEDVQVNLHYEHTRDMLLRSCDWNFAVKRLALVSTWLTGTVYIAGQFIWTNSLLYKCATGHTAGTFATDLTAVKWVLVTTRPSFGYSYQYDLPSDCLRFRGTDIDKYLIEGKLLLCDDQVVNIEYIYQCTDTTIWDTMFYEVVVLKLALALLHPLAGTSVVPMRQMLEQELYGVMSRARTITKQETNATGSSDWNNARIVGV
jgi:hypothetical protein